MKHKHNVFIEMMKCEDCMDEVNKRADKEYLAIMIGSTEYKKM